MPGTLQIRIRLGAVEWFLEQSGAGRFDIVTSDYLIMELMRDPWPNKRAKSLAMTNYVSVHGPVMKSVTIRAAQIERLGITGFDALHIAAAEAAGCEFLVSTDDRLLKKFQRIRAKS